MTKRRNPIWGLAILAAALIAIGAVKDAFANEPLFSTTQPNGSPQPFNSMAGIGVSTSNQGWTRVQNPNFTNCAVGGGTMSHLTDINSRWWDKIRQKCPNRNGFDALLIDVVNSGDSRLSDDAFVAKLVSDTVQVIAVARQVFPNVQDVYLSSIVYMGWSENVGKIGEPRGHLAGVAAQQVINTGVAVWGPYTWNTALVYLRSFFVADGHHLTLAGQLFVAAIVDAWLAGNNPPNPDPDPDPDPDPQMCPVGKVWTCKIFRGEEVCKCKRQ